MWAMGSKPIENTLAVQVRQDGFHDSASPKARPRLSIHQIGTMCPSTQRLHATWKARRALSRISSNSSCKELICPSTSSKEAHSGVMSQGRRPSSPRVLRAQSKTSDLKIGTAHARCRFNDSSRSEEASNGQRQ